jgi:hypothetical protein
LLIMHSVFFFLFCQSTEKVSFRPSNYSAAPVVRSTRSTTIYACSGSKTNRSNNNNNNRGVFSSHQAFRNERGRRLSPSITTSSLSVYSNSSSSSGNNNNISKEKGCGEW